MNSEYRIVNDEEGGKNGKWAKGNRQYAICNEQFSLEELRDKGWEGEKGWEGN